MQTAEYYPMGLAFNTWAKGKEKHRFMYQGQFAEHDEETGFSNFELRLYDPVIVRWLSVDPYGEFASPYLAMGNNPAAVDPDGGCTICTEMGLFFKKLFTGGRIAGSAAAGNQIVVQGVGAGLGVGSVFSGLGTAAAMNGAVGGMRSALQQGGTNIYAEISNSFNQTKYDYMFSENVGASATFNMIGHYSIHQIDGKYYFHSSAAGTTHAKIHGNVTFQGNAQVLVNGKKINSVTFRYGNGYNVAYPEGFSNLGGISFELPASGDVMINLQFSYHVIFGSAGQNHSSTLTIPVPARKIGFPKD